MATHDDDAPVIHIAILECFKFRDHVVKARGSFGDVFKAWILDSTINYNRSRQGAKDSRIQIKTSNFDVEEGVFPHTLGDIDVILVTGSASSAVDKTPWITELDTFLRTVYREHPRVKIVGGCFGHQIVSASLLKDAGCYVEKCPLGWEIGLQDVELNPRFRADMYNVLGQYEDLACQFLHADHVVVDKEALPTPSMNIGRTKLCRVQGIYEPGRVLTFQGHPELDAALVNEGVQSLSEKGYLTSQGAQPDPMSESATEAARVWGHILLEFITRRGGNIEARQVELG